MAEVGDTYVNGGMEIDNSAMPEEIHSYIRSIRTPVTLDIHDVLYSRDDIGGEMTVIMNAGKYNGYELKNSFPEYVTDHTYLLFVKTAPDGEQNIVMHQGSVELGGAGEFVPLFNEHIYDGLLASSRLTSVLPNKILPKRKLMIKSFPPIEFPPVL